MTSVFCVFVYVPNFRKTSTVDEKEQAGIKIVSKHSFLTSYTNIKLKGKGNRNNYLYEMNGNIKLSECLHIESNNAFLKWHNVLDISILIKK